MTMETGVENTQVVNKDELENAKKDISFCLEMISGSDKEFQYSSEGELDLIQYTIRDIKEDFAKAKALLEKFGQLSKDELCWEFFGIRAHLLYMKYLYYDDDFRLTNEKEYEKEPQYGTIELGLLGLQVSRLISERNFMMKDAKNFDPEQLSVKRKLIKEKIIECQTKINDIINKNLD